MVLFCWQIFSKMFTVFPFGLHPSFDILIIIFYIPQCFYTLCLYNPLYSSSPQLQWMYNFFLVLSLPLPHCVACVGAYQWRGYTIIQLSFRTGLDCLKGLTLKRGSLQTKIQNICHLFSSYQRSRVTFLKTHLAWIWSSYILTEALL